VQEYFMVCLIAEMQIQDPTRRRLREAKSLTNEDWFQQKAETPLRNILTAKLI
jgi:hypothetical protein